MKKIFFATIAVLLLASCGGEKSTTVVNGKIIGYADEYTEFFIPNDKGGFDEYPAEVAQDGTFSLKLKMDKDWFDAPFFVDKFMFRCCIERGKTYNATFDITVPEVEDRFSFEGEGAAENELTRVFFNHFASYDFISKVAGTISDYDSYLAAISEKAAECEALAKATENQPVIDYYMNEINQMTEAYKCYYPYFALSRDGEFDAAAMPVKDFSEMADGEFESFFSGVAAFAAGLDNLNLRKALELTSGYVPDEGRRNYALASLFKHYLTYGGTDGLKDAYDYFSSVCKDENYLNQIKGDYEAAMSMCPGSEASDIELEDREGNIVHLKDLRGAGLYIDFWATWCGPCCAEIPHMEKLAASFAGRTDVKCISISIDENKDDWKNKMDADNPAWPQYIATESGLKTISDVYKINSIPRFLTIDKNGLIVSPSAARPSSAEAAAEVEKAAE